MEWPRGYGRHVAEVVTRSWAAYEPFWGRILARGAECGTVPTPTGRLLANMMGTGFFTTPYWFLKTWFTVTVAGELEWRTAGDPRRWSSWGPRNKTFIDLGRAASHGYCGTGSRFDELLKELLR